MDKKKKQKQKKETKKETKNLRTQLPLVSATPLKLSLLSLLLSTL